MNITEAMRAVNDEYNIEVLRARQDRAFCSLMNQCIGKEYEEIDRELTSYVAEIAATMGVPVGTALPDYVYQMARMCFRIGMRAQRKIDHPEQATSMFWRSDEVKV